MKFEDMSLKSIVVAGVSFGVVIVAVGAFAPGLLGNTDGDPVPSNQVTYSVELKPGHSGVLEVKHADKCKQHGHTGCLRFEKDKVGLIKFFLQGSSTINRKCPKANSVITKIELTAKGIAPKSDPDPDDVNPEAEKGDFTGNLPDWVRDDAFSGVDLSTGIVYQATTLNDARTQELLVNMNSHNASEGVKSFWYKVTATACIENKDGTRDIWVSDPRGDNEGLN